MSFPSCEVHANLSWGVCPVCMDVVPYDPTKPAVCGYGGARYARHAYRSEYTGQPDEQGGCLRCGALEAAPDALPASLGDSSHYVDAMRYLHEGVARRHGIPAKALVPHWPRGYLTGKEIDP